MYSQTFQALWENPDAKKLGQFWNFYVANNFRQAMKVEKVFSTCPKPQATWKNVSKELEKKKKRAGWEKKLFRLPNKMSPTILRALTCERENNMERSWEHEGTS